MNCTTVRDRLAEHALGALTARDAGPIDRHLAWCAACRKEAGELGQASATLAFAVASHDPPDDLEDGVIAAVHRAVARRDRRPSASPRRSRLMIVAALAAALAVLGTGWGAVMAGRAARSDRVAQDQIINSQNAVARFRDLLKASEFADPQDEVFLGTLSPSAAGGGGGSALTLVSRSIIDMAIVLVNGVPVETRARLPFTIRLRGDDGAVMVGRIEKGGLDASGAGIVMREFDDLSGYDSVIVRDALGNPVMSGVIRTRAEVASPTP